MKSAETQIVKCKPNDGLTKCLTNMVITWSLNNIHIIFMAKPFFIFENFISNQRNRVADITFLTYLESKGETRKKPPKPHFKHYVVLSILALDNPKLILGYPTQSIFSH